MIIASVSEHGKDARISFALATSVSGFDRGAGVWRSYPVIERSIPISVLPGVCDCTVPELLGEPFDIIRIKSFCYSDLVGPIWRQPVFGDWRFAVHASPRLFYLWGGFKGGIFLLLTTLITEVQRSHRGFPLFSYVYASGYPPPLSQLCW